MRNALDNARAGLISRLLPYRAAALTAVFLTVPAVSTWAEAPLFDEVAAEVGLDFVHFNGMSGALYFAEVMGSGAALFDYDGDGDLDVYLVQGSLLGPGQSWEKAALAAGRKSATDRLFRNDLALAPDGSRRLRFTDVTREAGLTASRYGMGVATGDYDGDGDVDLYVTNLGPNQLLRNRGDGTFEDVTATAGADDDRWSVPATFLDFDRDGNLDLFIGNYLDFSAANHRPCFSESGASDYCGPLSYAPQADRLLRGKGDGKFEDVTQPAGLGIAAGGALGALAADLNGDGWIDLYVANDEKPNHLWINQRDGTFLDEALLSGCAVNGGGEPEASMGIAAGDVDGDGYTDLFLTHIRGQTNTLYLGDGHALFRDATRKSGLGLPSFSSTGFGTALFDAENDGRLDLFVANGAVRRIQELVEEGHEYPLHQTNHLFRNLGGGRFEDVSASAGPALALSEVSRGVAVGDLDNDGDSDLLITNNRGPVRLLLNRTDGAQPWLGLDLVAGVPPRHAPGTWVEVLRGDAGRLSRRAAADGSYAVASDPRVLVGLGTGPAVTALLVHWGDGTTERFEAPPGGRYTTLERGKGARER